MLESSVKTSPEKSNSDEVIGPIVPPYYNEDCRIFGPLGQMVTDAMTLGDIGT